jgi:hypothetical protein
MVHSSGAHSRWKRRDGFGRAFAGSQMHLQVWVNCRRERLNRAVGELFGAPARGALDWRSPVPPQFTEFRDGAFLSALGLSSYRSALRVFWPRGGPVWDGLALARASTGALERVVLVEAKSYPEEVYGAGCLATPESDARTKIEESLSATATWLGAQDTRTWLGRMYQSANRLAHVYFLREIVGVDAYMVNICFENDPRHPTSRTTWLDAHEKFRANLGLEAARVPWLADIVLPAADRSELLSLAI